MIIESLAEWDLRTDSENNLQSDVAAVLTSLSVAFDREVALSVKDRIDFLAGDVGIECKVSGACAEVLRQLSRYAQSERVGSIILVTKKATHRRIDGVSLNGKVVNVLWVNNDL